MPMDKVTANLFFEAIKIMHEEVYQDLSESILGKKNINERNYDTMDKSIQSDKVHELIRRNIWIDEIDMSVWERIHIRCVSNMSKNHITFPDIIYNRNVMNEYSFILEAERIINSILNKSIYHNKLLYPMKGRERKSY